MPNVTRSLGVVQEVDSLVTLAPPPGTRLAVFRRNRWGERFEGLLAPGEALAPRLLERRSSIRLLAVSTNPNLRHEFGQSYLHRDQLHNFDLHFRIGYRIADPSRLIETLTDDPLARVQREVQKVLGDAVQGMDWNEIRDGRHEVGRRALLASPPSADGILEDNLTRLRRFAEGHGIELLEVEVTCRVGERAMRGVLLEDDKGFEKEQVRQNQAVDEQRRLGEKAIRLEEEEADNLIAAVRRSRTKSDRVLHHLDTALGKVAAGVDSAPALRRAIVDLAEMHGQLMQITATDGDGPPRLGGRAAAALESAQDPLSGPRELLAEALDQVGSLDRSLEERRRILGRLLLVHGEALLGDEGDAAELERRVADLAEALEGCVRSLRSSQQRRFFRDLCTVEWWRARA